jgi:hypothetical protein
MAADGFKAMPGSLSVRPLTRCTVPAAVLGGVSAIALLWMKLFPALRKVEKLE